MTDKVQKIRKEVEKLKLCTMDEHMKFYSEAAEAEYNALCEVEKTIDSLQEEPVSEDLEEESKKYSSCIYLEEVLSDDDKEVLRERLINTFKTGAQWKEQQMMKNAVECDVRFDGLDLYTTETWDDMDELLHKINAKEGDKVKLIIIKEK